VRVMITGAHGLLGQKLALVLAQESLHAILLTDLAPATFFKNARFEYQQLDITMRGDVKSLVAQWRPDVIINTAAMTDVDGCETDREACWRLNVDGLKNLIIPAKKLERCRIIQLSTDYVFDGNAPTYDETSRPNPMSYYGKSKLAAENALASSGVQGAIARTQVLYGTGYNVRQNFVAWVLAMLEKGKPFRVVDDQVGNPTLADDLAYALLLLAESSATGLYHISGPEAVDRFTFAKSIATVFGFSPDLISATTSGEIGQAANRPMNSAFITIKFEAEFRYRLSDTERGLKRLVQQYRDGERHIESLISAEH
jgi:dTDP-4-dehydrorhamnose reductase